MSVEKSVPLTEDARRYYLDMMGIQCWESLYDEVASTDLANTDVANTEITSTNIASTDITSERVTAYQAIESEIEQCKKCQLHTTRKQAILGRGNQSAALMFVLLSPDKNDDEAGTLCTDEAGELFSKMLAAINLSIDDVYITSLLKCCVPLRHTVSTGEINHCNDYLKQQIRNVRPELLIVLGDTAARCMFQKDIEIDKLRTEMNVGDRSVMSTFENVPTLVSYSPQELLQKAENKRKAWSDLKLIQQML